MKFKALGAFAGLALLAACSSTPTASNTATGAGMSSNTGAQPGSATFSIDNQNVWTVMARAQFKFLPGN